jgi:hypothetical protein
MAAANSACACACVRRVQGGTLGQHTAADVKADQEAGTAMGTAETAPPAAALGHCSGRPAAVLERRGVGPITCAILICSASCTEMEHRASGSPARASASACSNRSVCREGSAGSRTSGPAEQAHRTRTTHHTCVHGTRARACAHTHAQTQAHGHARAHARTRTHAHTRTHARTRARTRTRAHTRCIAHAPSAGLAPLALGFFTEGGVGGSTASLPKPLAVNASRPRRGDGLRRGDADRSVRACEVAWL